MTDYDDMPLPPGMELDQRDNGQPAAVLPPVMPTADLSQATTVELGRAVAEVQAQVIVARQFPRNLRYAEDELRHSCSRPEMAGQAFYTFERGKRPDGKPNVIHGPTVQLMREAARCFGNVQSGIVELRRMTRQSEMMAWAWDLEKNVRMSTTFYVSHAIDTRTGKRELESDRDIYDNNANLGARREREMIRRVLPAWYVHVAIVTASKTLTGTPEEFKERVEKGLAVLARRGVTAEMLEDRFGLPRTAWTDLELVQLQIVYSTLQRGEQSVAELFPEPAQDQAGSAAGTLQQAAQDQQGKPGAEHAGDGTVGAGAADKALARNKRKAQGAVADTAGPGPAAKMTAADTAKPAADTPARVTETAVDAPDTPPTEDTLEVISAAFHGPYELPNSKVGAAKAKHLTGRIIGREVGDEAVTQAEAERVLATLTDCAEQASTTGEKPIDFLTAALDAEQRGGGSDG